jgi:hypothetical protein
MLRSTGRTARQPLSGEWQKAQDFSRRAIDRAAAQQLRRQWQHNIQRNKRSVLSPWTTGSS